MDVLEKYNTKIFAESDIEWVRFVLANRGNKAKSHNYDIVEGPTADDNTKLTFNTFRAGGYGDPQGEKAIITLINLLETDNLPMQSYFGTNKVVKELIFKGVTKLL